MKTQNVFIFGAIVLLIVLSGCTYYGQNQGNTTPTNPVSGNNVEISNFAFHPQQLIAKQGDTVTWTNNDPVAHQIVSDSGSELGSSPISQGETYSHTFALAGTYGYHCAIHPSMKGEIIVQ